MHAMGEKESLTELALNINHITMDLEDFKAMLKPIRSVDRLSDLKLDITI